VRCTQTLFDGVVLGRETTPVSEALEALVRLRAVQEFSPSEAVSFVFALKRAVREHLRELGAEGELWSELVTLDEGIDGLASTAFDLYDKCRERVYAIRMDAHRRSTASLLMQLDARKRADGSAVAACGGGRPEGGWEP
jgi:hypothetical protein